MITALQAPAAGAVLLDANNTIIKIQSDNGQGFFFRAEISVDGVLFDTQGWSRQDVYTAIADLKKLYYASFSPVFNAAQGNGLVEQSHLRRQVSIVIKEYAHSAPTVVVQSITLPSFHIMYCIKPESFSQAAEMVLLGVEKTLYLPATGKLVLPFYVNAAFNPSLNVSIITPTGTVVNTVTAQAAGKKVFLYTYNLADAGIGYNVPWLNVRIRMSLSVINLVVRLNHRPNFPVKEIAYRNNFGFYLYAYPDGQLEVNNSFAPGTYETLNGDQVYEVNEDADYSINSGSFRETEMPVLRHIANSIDTRIKVGTAWHRMETATKKLLTKKDRLHQFSAELQFNLKLGGEVENTGMNQTVVLLPNIQITNVVVNGNQYTMTFVYNNGFIPAGLVLQYRFANSQAWNSIPLAAGTTSPLNGSFSPNSYFVRLQESGFPANVSNQVAINIE